MKNRSKGLAIAISLGMVVLAGAVHSATTNILVEGTITDSKLLDGPARVTTRILTMKPGEALPWHYHPGYAFNVVKSGTLTVDDGCGGVETLTAGQGFEEMDGRVHRGKNIGTTDVVVYDTFITVDGKPTTITIPGNEPRCGPPRDAGECQNSGWQKFTHPQKFMNERECLDAANRRPAPFHGDVK
jgi:quercetin dioxygenase-like cupin family protein